MEFLCMSSITYKITFTGTEYAGNKVAYNSEPGYLFSSNDWYIMSSGLVRTSICNITACWNCCFFKTP